MGYIGAKEPAFIEAGSINNSDLADTSQYRLKGRIASGAGAPEDLTADQAITLLNQASSSALDAARVNSYYRTLRVNSGSDLSRRLRVNYIPGSGISISAADDAINEESDLTIALAAIGTNRVLGNVSGSSAQPAELDSDALFTVINSSGTAQLANNRLGPLSPSPAGTYIKPDITVDAQGRITAVTSGNLISNADISLTAEIAVSKLADGTARQLLQTDGAGTGVEWTSDVDIPGTLDVTGAATFDSTATATSFIPTGSAVPTNGVYLPAANSVGISTNGSGRLFVDASGNVGIGNATPGNSASGANQLVLGSGSGSRGVTIYSGTSSNGSILFADGPASSGADSYRGIIEYNHTSDYLYFGTNAQERLRITSTGLVGIGTSSPDTVLHTYGGFPTATIERNAGAGGAASLGLTNSTDSGFLVTGSDTTFTITASTAVTSGTGLTECLRIDSSGRVGIGTTSPGAALEINAAASTSPAIFKINTSEVGRWDSSGRLLVGTSTATNNTRLDLRVGVVGTGGEFSGISNTSYSGTTASVASIFDFQRSRGATDGSMTAVASGDDLGFIVWRGADGTNFVNAAVISAQVDGTPGANDMPGRLVFSTTADGASSPTERLRITSTGQVRLAGAGITFNGDTAAANELDDYEEGTWTPTVIGTSVAGTATYTRQQGFYTKIGNRVDIWVDVIWTGGTGTGLLRISGLPFTSNSTSMLTALAAYVSDVALTANNVASGVLSSSSNVIAVNQVVVGGGTGSNAPYDAAGQVTMSGSYRV